MSGAPEPIAEGEFVLRRVHRNHCSVGLPRTVHFAAFRPSREDISGLSVFREKYVSAAEVAASGRRPGEYFVTRLPVKALHDLGLTIVPDVDAAAPRGHALIPELTHSAYERDKQRLKDVLLSLALLAGRAVVHQPKT
jgi:hypothetical protein